MYVARSALYREGGLVRFYRGYFAALAQAPLAVCLASATRAVMCALY